jgi:para-aminobenzoate synthetase component I
VSEACAVPFVEELRPAPDPVVCCERLAGLPYRLFLDSAARGTRLGRYSFLSADPVAVVRSKGATTEYTDLVGGASHRLDGDALTAVRALLAPYAAEPVPELPPFQGGAAGYLAYDWGRVLEALPTSRYDDLGLDDVVLGIYDWVLAWDHEQSRTFLVSTGLPEAEPKARTARANRRAAWVRSRVGAVSPAEEQRTAVVRTAPTGGGFTGAFGLEPDEPRESAPSYPVDGGWWEGRLPLRSSFTRDGYLAAVRRVREYILAGDIFQANLSQRFEAPLAVSPWALYRRLRERNPAPFAAFFDLPAAAIISASPERFLRVDHAGAVETRPIKGTRPRGVGPEHDAALGQALTESAKDRAENLMIVDLMRNDLSRVCAPGSVRVPELFTLERYATVHHLVSTVVGTLAPGTGAVDLMRAAFPGGSITGAPKIRAMEIIAELEPSQRGVYSGAIGYLSLTGDLDTNIAIRSAVVANGRVYFSAGGGIVADSDPQQEYRETLDKARALIDVLATFV